ncbi:alpha/beta fold hydrolase [Amycolatopsis anabasis]|uniref:alpha/beta fold hydrolase n=1 Tax=Amycolatopsis anabasis TaxID=1840409 RepID=UPI00131E1917|nr:alpha/beta hydrolase [Amycolatopsis anabasis]
MPRDPLIQRFRGRDGTELAFRELGEGRPLVLIHGYFSTAMVTWVGYGHAEELVARGYRLILPDLRGHGDSAKPHDAAAYPPDVLADDGFALIEHLGLTDYDLGGYSLGARTTLRMLARGARPGQAILGGLGLDGVVHATGRRGGDWFRHLLTNLGTFEPGSMQARAEEFLHAVGGDPVALLHVLGTSVDTPREALGSLGMPILVATGEEDDYHHTAGALAAALPAGRHVVLPGDHTTAVTTPEFGAALAEFLAGRGEDTGEFGQPPVGIE